MLFWKKKLKMYSAHQRPFLNQFVDLDIARVTQTASSSSLPVKLRLDCWQSMVTHTTILNKTCAKCRKTHKKQREKSQICMLEEHEILLVLLNCQFIKNEAGYNEFFLLYFQVCLTVFLTK